MKFHLHTQQGIKNLTDAEAEAIIAKDRESHQRDLYESIEKGDFPKWTMYIQVMTEEQAKNCPFNPFDLTKVWSQKEYPLIEVGVMELNRNPENYFADDRAGGVQSGQCGTGYQFLPRPYAARTSVLLRRYTALPTGSEPSPDSGQPQSLSFPEYVSSGRTDARRRKPRVYVRI